MGRLALEQKGDIMNEVRRVLFRNKGTDETRNRLARQISETAGCCIADYDPATVGGFDSTAVFDCDCYYENDLIRYILGSDFETKNVRFGDYASRVFDSRISDFENVNVDYFECTRDREQFDFEKDRKPVCSDIRFVNVSDIIPIEAHDPDRVDMLAESIVKEALWKVPVIVEGKDNMLLDGHHRLQVAKKIGLVRIPAIVVDYDRINVWSLRENEGIVVDQDTVRNHAVENHLVYPYKTVKHKYPFRIPEISYSLEVLS